MNIKDALKETGKATGLHLPFAETWFVAIDDEDFLWLYNDIGAPIQRVPLREILRSDWQPYHDKKYIRPEKPGELWERQGEKFFIFFDNDKYVCLCLVDESGDKFSTVDAMSYAEVIHNQNGWTRLYPPVEDENVERIEIEGVEWEQIMTLSGGRAIVPYWPIDGYSYVKKSWLDKPSMKMILEIPKEDA